MKKREADEAKKAARAAAAERRRHHVQSTTNPGMSYAQATRPAPYEAPTKTPQNENIDERIRAVLDEVLPDVFRRYFCNV